MAPGITWSVVYVSVQLCSGFFILADLLLTFLVQWDAVYSGLLHVVVVTLRTLCTFVLGFVALITSGTIITARNPWHSCAIKSMNASKLLDNLRVRDGKELKNKVAFKKANVQVNLGFNVSFIALLKLEPFSSTPLVTMIVRMNTLGYSS